MFANFLSCPFYQGYDWDIKKELLVKYIEYGSEDGRIVVYFHGVPGAIEESFLFNRQTKKNNLRILCFDRFSIVNTLTRKEYYNQIASQIKMKVGTDAVDLIGFSIGAHVALEVSALLNNQVRQVHLISAAAPLDAGSYINSMAGGIVFKLAKGCPLLFYLLTRFQKLLALMAPDILMQTLFSSATAGDKLLSTQKEFRNFIIPVLQHCFKNRSDGYVRDINYYVNWKSDDLSKITESVWLWHGSEDNWSPKPMAVYLSDMIPCAELMEVKPGLSHYSCLYESISEICQFISSHD